LLTTNNGSTEFIAESHFSFLQSFLHEVLVSERVYHSVEREFANFKISGIFAFFVNLCETSYFITVKYNFKSYICFMPDNLLLNIDSPYDLRQLDEAQLPQLAQELRNFIIDVVSVKKDILALV
jgi:hypothetical protein